MKKQKLRKEKRIIKLPISAKVLGVLITIYALLLMYPNLVALNGALRDWSSFVDNIFGVSKLTLENFKTVFTEFNYPVSLSDGRVGAYYFDGLLTNTLLYCIGCSLAGTICPCIVGYCTSKFPYKFSKFIISMIYVLMGLPIIGTVTSEIQMTRAIGIYDTMFGMWFLKFGFNGLSTLLFNNVFSSISNEYMEAARMDGAGNWQIFTRVMFPMAKSTFSVLLLMSFTGYWSDYSTPMYFLPSRPTLALTLLNFTELSGTTETMQMAACVLLAVPGIVLFICFKEKFMQNLQVGGIKG